MASSVSIAVAVVSVASLGSKRPLTVGADVARLVDVDEPGPHQLKVCSTTCARAAAAGEYTDE